MSDRYMVLPARDCKAIRLVRIPDDLENQEAFRSATGLVARAEQANPGCTPEDILTVLEEQGFEAVDFVLGPVID